MKPIEHRYDFVYLYDVRNGNPNGDPDADNTPRMDPETSQGLVTDVCLKRKIRDYVAAENEVPDLPRNRIYVASRAILNQQHDKAWDAVMPEASEKDRKKLPTDKEKAREITAWMCANFYDIRTFGAVMTTGKNCGQVRGPVQLTFSRSAEPIIVQEIALTRMAATTEKDADAKGDIRTMGRKHIVPYGLYRAHGFVSAALAGGKEGTGFSDEDLELLWRALENMFEIDRSAARGEMTARRLVVFKHSSRLGNAHAHKLFDRVRVLRAHEGKEYVLGTRECADLPPARSYTDYAVHVNTDGLPTGIEADDRI